MAPVKCQLINPRECEKIPNKPHLIISKTISPIKTKKKKKNPSRFIGPHPSAVTTTATATTTLSFCFLPKPHPHAHLHLCFDSPLFLVDEANLQPFHGFCESLFSSSSKLACDASILSGLLKKKETMMLLYMLSIRFVTCLSRQACKTKLCNIFGETY
ncbi:hypothetical protein RGQ29_028600 [Quercus rubra]|uniref:Uncharacterized protein n=1 Tax=Quercus rubra TaxID=3512 RepID=A0AAN7ESA6_QUERU|nr:hypothetical protein RGQ29_028600 [Quercus rubra]